MNIQPDSTGLYHPTTDGEIVELIQYAIANKLQVRVMGAGQSTDGSVYSDGYDPTQPPGKNINIELDQMRSVDVDESKMQATVGAGCNLGYNPFDPSGISAKTEENNLFFQLHQKGLAIPNVPDELHQTVGGFISTGSSGGSMHHSFDECILSIRMIDGTGKIQTFSKSDNMNDSFYGVVVSMGLMGIITSVTLQCVPAFAVNGTETTTKVSDCEYNFLDSGTSDKISAQQFLETTEYSRTMWWPFSTLERTVVWKATSIGSPANFAAKPYHSIFPTIDGSVLPTETFAASGFQMIATWPDWFDELIQTSTEKAKPLAVLIKSGIEAIFPHLYPKLIDFFMPINTEKHPPKTFWDYWYKALPMDSAEFSNNLFDLTYTEMWMPIGQTNKILSDMQNFYTQNGYAATGFFTIEVFGAKASNFWLSPAYQQDSVRINLLWFRGNKVPGQTYFAQFWSLLAQYNYRLHWGKSLPPATTDSVSYLSSRYTKWSNWKALRDQMDPHQIFLTSYWRAQLGITSTAS